MSEKIINKGREGYKETKIGWLPIDWRVMSINDTTDRRKSPVKVKKNETYREIGIRSHGKGLFYKKPVSGESISKKSVFWVVPNCLVLNIVFAWEQAVSKTTINEQGMIASHRFPMYKPKEGVLNLDFIFYYLMSTRGKHSLGLASPGGAGRNKTLGQREFGKMKIPVPSIKEQEKIVSIISTWDIAINRINSLIEAKEKLKKGIMDRLISAEIRFPGFTENWKEKKIRNILSYERPERYIVKKVNKTGDLPVLTANKSFILGYSSDGEKAFLDYPVIIFDDFTTDHKYVDFEFVLKSSAIKILKTKENYDIYWANEMLKRVHIPNSYHRRYYISEYQSKKVKVPPYQEQKKIGNLSRAIDAEIKTLKNQLSELKKYKIGVMQRLLTGSIRVKEMGS